jgi:hypothetical protein
LSGKRQFDCSTRRRRIDSPAPYQYIYQCYI